MAQPSSDGPIVRVVGDGSVRRAPDLAGVSLGVIEQQATASEAQAAANATANAIIEAIKGMGIDGPNIQTSRISLSPMYENRTPGGVSERRVIAYQASNTVSVRLTDLSKVGGVIDAGVKAGANQVQGVSFSLSESTEAQGAALKRATRAGRAKAQAIAEGLGMRLGEVIEVVEGGASGPQPYPMARGMMAMESAGAPVEPGEIEVSAQVQIAYRLVGG